MNYLFLFRPDLGTLSPAHRLDKPVSGVLLLTRNSAAAEAMRGKITERKVSKAYVARVEGTLSPRCSCTFQCDLFSEKSIQRGTAALETLGKANI